MKCRNENDPVRCLERRRAAFDRERPGDPCACSNCKVGRKREEAAARRRPGAIFHREGAA